MCFFLSAIFDPIFGGNVPQPIKRGYVFFPSRDFSQLFHLHPVGLQEIGTGLRWYLTATSREWWYKMGRAGARSSFLEVEL